MPHHLRGADHPDLDLPPLIAAILIAASSGAFAAPDIYDEVNRLRAGEGACASRDKRPALVRRPALETAAEALARGKTLRESLREAGYRSTRSIYFSIVGDDVGRRAPTLLAQKYCEQLRDAGLVDVGAYQDTYQVWVVAAAPFAPRVSVGPDEAARRVLALTNRARAESRRCGERAFRTTRGLRWSAALAKAALVHSEDMARHDYLGHDGSDGSTPAERMERAGYAYRATGENIAGGPSTPEGVLTLWLESPTHCATLMNPGYTEMGLAYAVDRDSHYGVYWTQVFGASP